jgi:hypothetical protein
LNPSWLLAVLERYALAISIRQRLTGPCIATLEEHDPNEQKQGAPPPILARETKRTRTEKASFHVIIEAFRLCSSGFLVICRNSSENKQDH